GGVGELLPVVDCEGERADPGARARRLGEADDDELLALHAFRLSPRRPAPGRVGGVAPLAHDALEAGLARVGEELGPVPDDVVAVPDPPAPAAQHLRADPHALPPPP